VDISPSRGISFSGDANPFVLRTFPLAGEFPQGEIKEKGVLTINQKCVRTIKEKRNFACHNCLLQKQKIAESLENKGLYSQ
jgi:hypothetical protein